MYKRQERYLSNLNCGETNGLLMGNYISLYFAEKKLSEISHLIEPVSYTHLDVYKRQLIDSLTVPLGEKSKADIRNMCNEMKEYGVATSELELYLLKDDELSLIHI